MTEQTPTTAGPSLLLRRAESLRRRKALSTDKPKMKVTPPKNTALPVSGCSFGRIPDFLHPKPSPSLDTVGSLDLTFSNSTEGRDFADDISSAASVLSTASITSALTMGDGAKSSMELNGAYQGANGETDDVVNSLTNVIYLLSCQNESNFERASLRHELGRLKKLNIHPSTGEKHSSKEEMAIENDSCDKVGNGINKLASKKTEQDFVVKNTTASVSKVTLQGRPRSRVKSIFDSSIIPSSGDNLSMPTKPPRPPLSRGSSVPTISPPNKQVFKPSPALPKSAPKRNEMKYVSDSGSKRAERRKKRSLYRTQHLPLSATPP
mmetsp:Transcript_38567/g.82288  ORF Transcript_38567/g.82288 Transcript_38567/m.82288 type:complete len:322 (-) Transcript_38567:253-1218(-)